EARARPRPETYLQGMDAEGINIAILAPSVTFKMVSQDDLDPRHALALCRAYNAYAADFSAAQPDRLKFWAWLPRQDARLASQEARRCIEELGAVGVAISTSAVDGHLLSDEVFEPLWAELGRLRVPLGLHPSFSSPRDDIRVRFRGHPRTELVTRSLFAT